MMMLLTIFCASLMPLGKARRSGLFVRTYGNFSCQLARFRSNLIAYFYAGWAIAPASIAQGQTYLQGQLAEDVVRRKDAERASYFPEGSNYALLEHDDSHTCIIFRNILNGAADG
jgi:hypothetical protein